MFGEKTYEVKLIAFLMNLREFYLDMYLQQHEQILVS